MFKDRRLLVLFTVGLLIFSIVEYLNAEKLTKYIHRSIYTEFNDFKHEVESFNDGLNFTLIQKDPDLKKLRTDARKLDNEAFSLLVGHFRLSANINSKLHKGFLSKLYSDIFLVVDSFTLDDKLDSDEIETLRLISKYNNEFIGKYNELRHLYEYDNDNIKFVDTFSKSVSSILESDEYRPLTSLIEKLEDMPDKEKYEIKGEDTQAILDYTENFISDYGILKSADEYDSFPGRSMPDPDNDFYAYHFEDRGKTLNIYRKMYSGSYLISEQEIDEIHKSFIEGLPVDGYEMIEREVELYEDKLESILYRYKKTSDDFNYFDLRIADSGNLDSIDISNIDKSEIPTGQIMSAQEVIDTLAIDAEIVKSKIMRDEYSNRFYRFTLNIDGFEYVLDADAKTGQLIDFSRIFE